MPATTTIFNLTQGSRTVVKRYAQGESDAEFWGRAICEACHEEGEHYVSFDTHKGRGPDTWARERVYVKYGQDTYAEPRKVWKSEHPFRKITGE